MLTIMGNVELLENFTRIRSGLQTRFKDSLNFKAPSIGTQRIRLKALERLEHSLSKFQIIKYRFYLV